MSRQLFGITFASFQNIWVLPVVLAMLGVVCWAWYKRTRIIQLLAAPEWRAQLLKGYSPSKQLLKFLLWTIGLGSLGMVLLQPQWDKKEETVQQSGRDVVFALDISRSMLAQDLEPNRLTRAKRKIKDLVKTLDSERVGLLLFAGATIIQCPLTTDHQAFFSFLEQVDSDTVSSSGTSIAKALDKALWLFSDQPKTKTKIVIVVTDGEDFSKELSSIKERAKEQGVVIAAIGVGTKQGAPIPLVDPQGTLLGYQKDDDDSIVFSKLDESLLQDIVHSVGGKYVTLSTSSEDITIINRFISQFEKSLFDDTAITGLQDKYPYFAAIALGAFILEWLL